MTWAKVQNSGCYMIYVSRSSSFFSVAKTQEWRTKSTFLGFMVRVSSFILLTQKKIYLFDNNSYEKDFCSTREQLHCGRIKPRRRWPEISEDIANWWQTGEAASVRHWFIHCHFRVCLALSVCAMLHFALLVVLCCVWNEAFDNELIDDYKVIVRFLFIKKKKKKVFARFLVSKLKKN